MGVETQMLYRCGLPLYLFVKYIYIYIYILYFFWLFPLPVVPSLLLGISQLKDHNTWKEDILPFAVSH